MKSYLLPTMTWLQTLFLTLLNLSGRFFLNSWNTLSQFTFVFLMVIDLKICSYQLHIIQNISLVCNTRVSMLGWLKSFILIPIHQLHLCPAKCYFGCNLSDSSSFYINVWWLRSPRCHFNK